MNMVGELETLLRRARTVKMTDNEVQAQRRSFAYGNAGFENPDITRQMIDEEDEARKAAAA
jgi:hypothetical protein